MMKSLIRSLLLVPCLSLPGCLLHSEIVTENLLRVYVHKPDENTLLISGTTANVADLENFVIDNPITYGNPVKNSQGDVVESSKTYTNVDGDELIFTREYRTSTKQYFEHVTVRPKEDDEYELGRLKGHLGTKRVVAYGFYF